MTLRESSPKQMLTKLHRPLVWTLIFICAWGGILAVIFLRPVPDLDFLYSNYPELEGSIPANVIGTEVIYFLDPSFYYKFDGSAADAARLAGLLKLEPVTEISIYNPGFHPTGLFWHDWLWWHPSAANTFLLFNAYRNGNDIYLMYDAQDQVIYLYIQNT